MIRRRGPRVAAHSPAWLIVALALLPGWPAESPAPNPAPSDFAPDLRREYAVATWDIDGAGPEPPRNVILDTHDGDTATFVVEISRLNVHHATFASFPVRLAGYDAPELSEPGGIEARDYLAAILRDAAPTSVHIRPTGKLSFGRVVAEVTVSDPAADGCRVDVAELMRKAGQVKAEERVP